MTTTYEFIINIQQIMKDLTLLISIGLLGIFFTSCGPVIIEPITTPSNIPSEASGQVAPKADTETQTVTSQAQKDLREQAQNTVEQSSTTSSITTPSLPQPATTNYPVAIPIPGKPGYVYNPYNNNPVYVEGIPSGKTVRDPKDPNTNHVFRLP